MPVCLIGARARSIWLENIYGLRERRSTSDSDFVVHVGSWSAFERLADQLVEAQEWRKDRQSTQRFYTPAGQMVDLVPCGDIAENGTVAWPPDGAQRMDVRGLELAIEYGIALEIAEGRAVAVAPLPVLSLLKVIAWYDRPSGRERDAQDLLILLDTYADTQEFDALLSDSREHDDLYELEDDLTRRGARLLGRTAADIADADALELCLEILGTETDATGSLQMVIHGAPSLRADESRREDIALDLLEAFFKGLHEPAGNVLAP